MSKGNIFLGTARGKVGDVVQYRRLGEQGTRVYVKEVSNPKSQSQSAQRLKLNPAQKFYQGFQEILNHSWQSVPYGMRSYAYFLKQAMKATTGPYVDKGNTEIIPWAYPVSHGSLQSFEIVDASFTRLRGHSADLTQAGQQSITQCDTTFLLPTNWVSRVGTNLGELTYGTFCQLLLDANSDLQNGDQITVLAMSVDCTGTATNGGFVISAFNTALNTVCRYKRMVIDSSSTTKLSDADPFLMIPLAYSSTGGGTDLMTNSFRAALQLGPFMHSGGSSEIYSMPVAVAFIISRFSDNTWMRSSSTMHVYPQLIQRFGSSTAANSAINSYAAEQSIALTSTRYLNNAKKDEAYAVSMALDSLADGTTPKITTEHAKSTTGGTGVTVALGYNSLTQQNEVITDDEGYIIVPVGTPSGSLLNTVFDGVVGAGDWTRVCEVAGESGSETFEPISAADLKSVANGTWGTNDQYYVSNNINIL